MKPPRRRRQTRDMDNKPKRLPKSEKPIKRGPLAGDRPAIDLAALGPHPLRDPPPSDQPKRGRPFQPDLSNLRPGIVDTDTKPAGGEAPADKPAQTDLFGKLDPGAPLVLLPVRLETVFDGPDKPDILKIRIYPDDIHIDDHDPRLTPEEEALGREFWSRYEKAADDERRADVAAWIIAAVSERRAAHILNVTDPKDPRAKVTKDAGRRPSQARCLPRFWRVVGYRRNADGSLVPGFTKDGEPIPAQLATDILLGETNDPDAPPERNAVWMSDFGIAKKVGMGLEIDLAGKDWVIEKGIALLLVYGVGGPASAKFAGELESLLEAHRFGEGLAFQAQGVPTNSVGVTKSPLDNSVEAQDGTLARVLDKSGPSKVPNGGRAAHALGLDAAATLARIEGAERDDDAGQAWMNEALWAITWGQYFDTLMASPSGKRRIPQKATARARQLFLNRVRGGGPLPALRVGNQPYGVLPVRANHMPQQWTSPAQWLEFILVTLRDIWLAATPQVPKLTPGGNGTREEALDEVVRVLGGLPHPARFIARSLRDWRKTAHTSPWSDLLLIFLMLLWLVGDDPEYDYDSQSILGQWGWARAMLGDGIPTADGTGLPPSQIDLFDGATIGSSDEQLNFLKQVLAVVDMLPRNPEQRETARVWIAHMIRQVESHRDRLDPYLTTLQLGMVTDIDGILRDQSADPQIFYHLYDSKEREITQPLVSGIGADSAQYLAAAANSLGNEPKAPIANDSGGSKSSTGNRSLGDALAKTSSAKRGATLSHSRSGPFTSVLQPATVAAGIGTVAGTGTGAVPAQPAAGETPQKPLLQQMISAAVKASTKDRKKPLANALSALASLPPATLEWHMRETLGLASHRLDAWLTALASERLDELKSAEGSQYGGFGFVLDLKPDFRSETDGFLHAPTMQLALTGAMLRSAWLNHGTQDSASPLAVNLRSDRLRAADQLIEGVSQGRSLGELIGHGVERKLHDAELDVHLYPLRLAVLTAAGEPAEVKGPLDGMALVEALDAGDLDDFLATVKPARHRQLILDAIGQARDGFDALADAGLAEATHALGQGNMQRAAAVLDAISLGENPPSELRHARTDISRSELTHKVMLALPGQADLQGKLQQGRRGSHPALDSYVSPMLPDLTRVNLTVVAGDTVHVVPLTSLGLSPLDLVLEGARPGSLGLMAMAQLAREGQILPTDAHCRTSHGAAGHDAPVTVELEELEELCDRLARHIGALRSAGPADFDMAGTPLADIVDRPALRGRITLLAKRLEQRVAALEAALSARDPGLALEGLSLLASEGLPAALPGPQLYGGADLQPFWDHLAATIAAAGKRWEDVTTTLKDAAATPAVLHEALQLAGDPTLPGELPYRNIALPSGQLANPPDQPQLLDWIANYAHVRDDMQRWATALETVQLVCGKSGWPLRVCQSSTAVHPKWLGLHLPKKGTPGGMSWVFADAGGVEALVSRKAASAYVIDQWNERLPARRTTTGLAFQFDAPSSRPPQAILVAVTPHADMGWSDALLRRTILETIENAQIRAVTNDELGRFGHHMPAIFVPDGVDAGPQPPATEEPAA